MRASLRGPLRTPGPPRGPASRGSCPRAALMLELTAMRKLLRQAQGSGGGGGRVRASPASSMDHLGPRWQSPEAPTLTIPWYQQLLLAFTPRLPPTASEGSGPSLPHNASGGVYQALINGRF